VEGHLLTRQSLRRASLRCAGFFRCGGGADVCRRADRDRGRGRPAGSVASSLVDAVSAGGAWPYRPFRDSGRTLRPFPFATA